jgi:hypothetical protein
MRFMPFELRLFLLTPERIPAHGWPDTSAQPRARRIGISEGAAGVVDTRTGAPDGAGLLSRSGTRMEGSIMITLADRLVNYVGAWIRASGGMVQCHV